MYNVLITGASGMLGSTLSFLWKDKYNIFATSYQNYPNNQINNFKEFDLISNSYDDLINWSNPDIIVHCGAITNMDQCEVNPKIARAVNTESINKILAVNSDIKIIYISSDAVFPLDCTMSTEKEITNPITVYGKSKAIAEQYLLDSNTNHLIIRTTIVGININQNKTGFVDWIIDSALNQKQIKLFDDQIFTPISIWHLAKELEVCINSNLSGVLHIVGKDRISKFEFGKKLCYNLGLSTNNIKKSNINEFNFKAQRSKDQTMSSKYYESIVGYDMPSMSDTIAMLVKYFRG
jgi:dTDP-4-dehydrorhamnose reductase